MFPRSTTGNPCPLLVLVKKKKMGSWSGLEAKSDGVGSRSAALQELQSEMVLAS